MYIPIFCALNHHKRGQPYGAGYSFYMKCSLYAYAWNVCCLANGRLRKIGKFRKWDVAAGNRSWDKPLRYIITLTPYFLAPFSFCHIRSSSASFLHAQHSNHTHRAKQTWTERSETMSQSISFSRRLFLIRIFHGSEKSNSFGYFSLEECNSCKLMKWFIGQRYIHAIKHGHLSSIPGTHGRRREVTPASCPLTSRCHMCRCMSALMHTHTHNTLIKT